jgi:non-homologous end joining protein Ku
MSSLIRNAPVPTRATSTVVLSAGLINIPLGVYTAVESTTVVRREFFNGDPSIPVGRVSVRKDTDAVVHTTDVTRMTQADNDSWVVLDDAEIAECVGLSGACEVVCFVPVKDTGCYLTDGLYQVRPKSDKKGAAASTAAFGLLLAGMRVRKVHALVRFAMRNTPRYALLTADGDLLVIVTADGIRQAMPLIDTHPSKAEVDMVATLIDTIGIETPTVLDDFSPKVRAYVNAKAATGGVVPTSAPLVATNVVDIADLLAQSIEAAKAAKVATRKTAAKGKVA